MECLLIRHGIAVEPSDWDGADADRPLTERGEKRVAQVAAGLRRLEVRPSALFTSPYRRARQTAEILRAALEIVASMELADELVPEASPEAWIALFRDVPPDACVVCVGHEPHLSLAASLLLTGRPSTAFPFKKAGACLIDLPVPVKPGRGVLRWWMEPGQLRTLGKKKAKIEI